MACIAIVHLICFGWITGYNRAQDLSATKELGSEIDQFVVTHGITAKEPGVAILIYEPGKLLFKKGYGLANLKTGTPITTRTLFEIASLSKPFTATAVLLLMDRNQLSLDQDVRTILPELPDYRRGSPILVRDLLSHTSGLPEYFDFEVMPADGKSYVDNADYLPLFARLKEDYPQEFKAGTKYRYCNSNYMLLALIVERVSGKGFSEFMREEIFAPAGMNDTFIYASPTSGPAVSRKELNRAVGYEWSEEKSIWVPTWGTPPDRKEDGLVVGDGGVWTNLEDLAKWDATIRSNKLLKPKTWELAVTPATTRNGKPLEYGLGWLLDYEDTNEIEGFGHDGLWGGFKSSYFYSESTGRTIVMLCNRSDFDGDSIWTELNDIIEKQN